MRKNWVCFGWTTQKSEADAVARMPAQRSIFTHTPNSPPLNTATPTNMAILLPLTAQMPTGTTHTAALQNPQNLKQAKRMKNMWYISECCLYVYSRLVESISWQGRTPMITWSLAVYPHSYSNTFLLLTRKGRKYHTKLTDKDLMLEFEMQC